MYTRADAIDSDVDPPVPLGYKSPVFTGTGASHGKEEPSEKTFLPPLGGETTDLAMCILVAHVEPLYKPEVGIANVVGVVGSKVVTDHTEKAGPDHTGECETVSILCVTEKTKKTFYANTAGLENVDEYMGTAIPMTDNAYLYDTSETPVVDGTVARVGYYRV